ncbi:MAG: MFS transporter [Chloroflexota bacterium]|nr:MAG: MFS transporter [Chloroflexota bacterium]
MRDLRLARIHFFLLIGGVGFAYPFANLFYRWRGLSGTEIGLILTISSVIGLIAAPLWGRRSDANASLTRLLQVGLIASALALLALSQQTSFVWLAIFAMLQSAAGAGLSPLSDALALRITQTRRAGYGSVRVWGSAGWAVSVLVSGWLIERTSLVAGFVGSAVAFLVAAALVRALPAPILAPPSVPPAPARAHSLRGNARAVLQNRALLGLTLALLLQGLLGSGYMQFGNIYLEQLGASAFIIGVASMLGSVIELPGMFLGDRIVARVGAATALLFSFLLTGAPLLLVVLFPQVWAILTTRAIFGVAYSLFVIALVKYVTEHASAAQTATMLALFTVTLSALIQILAAPLAGIVFDAFGAYWLYALAVVGNLGAAALLFAFNRYARKLARQTTDSKTQAAWDNLE